MEDTEERDDIDETLCEISELLESMLLRLPEINHDFSLETKGSDETDYL